MKNRSSQMHLQTLLQNFHGITQIGIAYLPVQSGQTAAGARCCAEQDAAMQAFLAQLDRVPSLKAELERREAEAVAQSIRQQRDVDSFETFPGLTTYVFPVFSRGVLLGCFLFGPVRDGRTPQPYDQKQRAHLYQQHHLDADMMTSLFNQLPTLDKPAVVAASRLLSQMVIYADNVDSLTASTLPLSVRLAEYIDAQYMHPISPASACEHFHISRSTLSHTLSREYGDTFLSMLNRRRIRHVCKCLEEGLSPAEASAQSGFSSAAYMARVFRSIIGCTPHAYLRSLSAASSPLE